MLQVVHACVMLGSFCFIHPLRLSDLALSSGRFLFESIYLQQGKSSAFDLVYLLCVQVSGIPASQLVKELGIAYVPFL